MPSTRVALKSFDEVGRWDAEFFREEYQSLAEAIRTRAARPLGCLVREASRGAAPPYAQDGTIKVINSVNVRNFELSLERVERVEAEALTSFPNASVRPLDIVVTSTGIGTLGRAFCNISDEIFFADGHLTVLRLYNAKLAPFICAFLQSPLGRSQFIQRRRGSSRQVEIYPQDILSVLIPRCDDAAAHRIAKMWLDHVTRVELSKNLYPEAEQEVLKAVRWDDICLNHPSKAFFGNLRSFRDAGRADAEFFRPDYLSLERALDRSNAPSFGSLVKDYRKGVQPSAYAPSGSVAVIKSKDVVKYGINLHDCDRTDWTPSISEQGMVEPGMLLTNMTGVGSLGRAAVVPDVKEKLLISVDVAGWSLDRGLIAPEYAALFFNSPAGLAQSERYQTGSSGQLHLYPNHVSRFKVYLRRTSRGAIDLEWQERLVAKVKAASDERNNTVKCLREISAWFASYIGVNPSIVRE